MRILSSFALASMLAALPAPSWASETLYYCYDAQGRLTRVQHVNCSTIDALRTYTFDNADNRTNVTVVKANSRVVVVPLNGFTVIPIPDP